MHQAIVYVDNYCKIPEVVQHYCSLKKFHAIYLDLTKERKAKPDSVNLGMKNCHSKHLFEKMSVQDQVLFAKLIFMYIHILIGFELRILPTCRKSIAFAL